MNFHMTYHDIFSVPAINENESLIAYEMESGGIRTLYSCPASKLFDIYLRSMITKRSINNFDLRFSLNEIVRDHGAIYMKRYNDDTSSFQPVILNELNGIVTGSKWKLEDIDKLTVFGLSSYLHAWCPGIFFSTNLGNQRITFLNVCLHPMSNL